MIDDKKEAILTAAMQIFSTEGFHKAKISKIADIAGIGAGTVYLYFKNKESILEELFLRSWSRIETKLMNLSSIKKMTSKQKIEESISEITEMASANAAVSKMILHEFSFWSQGPSERVNKSVGNSKLLIKNIISDGIEKGEFRSELDPEQTTIFIIGGVWYNLALLSDNLTKENADEVANSICNLVINGLK